MAALADVLGVYLGNLGRLEPTPLGEEEEQEVTKLPSKRESDWLYAQLEKQSRTNNIAFFSLFAIIGILIFLIIALVVFLPQARLQTFLQAAFGGSIMGLLILMRRIWRDKTAADMMLALVPTLDPKEVLRVTEALYFSQVLGKI
jgi:hypothetical protein